MRLGDQAGRRDASSTTAKGSHMLYNHLPAPRRTCCCSAGGAAPCCGGSDGSQPVKVATDLMLPLAALPGLVGQLAAPGPLPPTPAAVTAATPAAAAAAPATPLLSGPPTSPARQRCATAVSCW